MTGRTSYQAGAEGTEGEFGRKIAEETARLKSFKDKHMSSMEKNRTSSRWRINLSEYYVGRKRMWGNTIT